MNNLKEKSSMVDEIADEVVELISNSEKLSDMLRMAGESGAIQKRNLSEINSLKERVAAMENRIEKYIGSFKITATEIEREMTEKFEMLDNETELKIMRLQEQIEAIRSMVNKLSNELKKIKS